jgi:hypothetical protein
MGMDKHHRMMRILKNLGGMLDTSILLRMRNELHIQSESTGNYMQVDLHSFETSIISPRLPNGLHSKSCSHQCIMYVGIILQCIHTTALIARLRVSMNIMRRLGRILSTCIAQMDTLGITNVGQQEERNVLRNMVSKNIWNICHLISRWRDVSVRLHTRSFHAKTIWTPH